MENLKGKMVLKFVLCSEDACWCTALIIEIDKIQINIRAIINGYMLVVKTKADHFS